MYHLKNYTKNKKLINKLQNYYDNEISLAIAEGYEGIVLPTDCSGEPYSLSYIDMTYIYELAYEYGWFDFAIIDFLSNDIEVINLRNLEAA